MMNMTGLTPTTKVWRCARWYQIGAASTRHCGRGFAAGLSARAGANPRDTSPVPPHGRGLPDH